MNSTELPVESMKQLTNQLANCCFAFTLANIKNRNYEPWSIHEQALHTHSEVTEVYEEIRGKSIESMKGKDEVTLRHLIQEAVDVIFSGFTLLNMIGYNLWDNPEDFEVIKKHEIDWIVDKLVHRIYEAEKK